MAVQISESHRATGFAFSRRSEIECRIRGEYEEMPGLRLSPAQAMRLWSLDRATCDHVLDWLIQAGFLQRDLDGLYARSDSKQAWRGLGGSSSGAPEPGGERPAELADGFLPRSSGVSF